MLKEIVAFEWRYHVRQPSFLAASLIFILMGFAIPASGFGPGNVPINSPFTVMQTTGFISLLSVFVIAVFAANAVMRDLENRMDGIVFSTAVGKFNYLLGRFLGASLAALSVSALAMLGTFAVRFAPWIEPARFAPVSARPYLESFLAISIPNIAFAAVLLFGIAVMTRNALATYAGSVVLYVAYMMSAALTNSPLMAASKPGAGGGTTAALLDPFGLSAFFEATRLWTAPAKTTNWIAIEPLLLGNRAIWLAASAAIWFFVYRSFSFRTRKEGAARAETTIAAPPRIATRRIVARHNGGSAFASFVSATKLHLRIIFTKPFVGLLLLGLGLAAGELYSDILDTEYGAAVYPAMGRVLQTLQQPLSIIGTIILIFYVSELFWREQRYRMASIIDATPTSGTTLLASKVATIAGMTIALIVAAVIPALALQLLRGPEHIGLAAYLVLFVSSGLPLLVLGVAVLLLNALSPNKYAGMVLSLLFVIVTSRPGIIGLRHPLWEYGSAPPVRHSEVSGFGYDLLPFAAFSLFWITVAVVFFLIASTLGRSLAFSVRERVRSIARVPRIATVIALILSFAIGGWLFANIDVEDRVAWRVDYEQTYGHFASKPQPRFAAIDTNVDLFDRRVRAAGHIELVNTSRVPISRVLVALRRDAKNVKLAIAGATMKHDARFGMYEFALAQPLQPGAHTRLQFDATFVRELFSSDEDDAIAPNGSFLMSFRILPTIGYRRTYELDDPVERRKRGLPTRMELIEGDIPADTEDIRFAATVSTPHDQTAIAPGTLERTWTRDGRRYARFTQASMRNFFAIGAGRFAMQKRMQGGRPIELYYEPSHAMNAKEILDVVAKSLEYCEKNFGPYRASQLRLAEVPSYWNFGAVAMPNTIFLTESRTFLIDTRNPDRPDLLGRRVAHEVAHQWWGYEVAPASGPGATFIVESFAKYTELMVLEHLRGREHVRRLLDVDRDRYLAGRANDETGEAPLLRARNQPHIYYGKGSLVLYAIRDLLGESVLNGALRAFVAEQSSRHGSTKAQDLMPHLRRVATDEQYALIEQWLGDIVLYDFAIASAEVKNGAITVRVKSTKTRADAEGNESPLPMREAIDLRVTDAEGKTLYERKHALDGDDVITIPFSGKPLLIEIDPWALRIDRNLQNNEAKLSL